MVIFHGVPLSIVSARRVLLPGAAMTEVERLLRPSRRQRGFYGRAASTFDRVVEGGFFAPSSSQAETLGALSRFRPCYAALFLLSISSQMEYGRSRASQMAWRSFLERLRPTRTAVKFCLLSPTERAMAAPETRRSTMRCKMICRVECVCDLSMFMIIVAMKLFVKKKDIKVWCGAIYGRSTIYS
jgi:hypothetical protein